MLIHPTVERLRCLGLAAMADALVELQNNPEAAEMPHADWLGLLIDREVTFRDNRRLSRRLTAARLRQAVPVQDAGDKIIIGNQHQLSDCGNHISGRAAALPTPSSGQAQLGVNAADPVDDQNDLGRRRIDIGDYFMDNGAHDALLQSRVSRWVSPAA